jgi:uncharacterized protein (UPF0332 family)
MTGDEFLTLADAILHESQGRSEAICRTAISRAYYGAFHLSLAFLQRLGVAVGKDHGDIWRCLASSQVAVAKQAATRLAMLHEDRTAADYRLDSPKPKNFEYARDCVDRGLYIQRLMETCGQEPARSQIKAGIESNRQRAGLRGSS